MFTPQDIALSRSVRANDLSPRQHRAQRNFRIATSYWLAPLLKMPGASVGEFHSYAEYLNAGIGEGNPQLSVLIPQPYFVKYQGKPYKPDALEIVAGQRWVVELKPRGEMDTAKHAGMTAFFKQYDQSFVVRSNETVLEQEWEAINWHSIVQMLTIHATLETTAAEQQLMLDWPAEGISTLGDWVDAGDRESSIYQEIALYRLAHRGWLHPVFNEGPLDYATEFHRCHPGEQR